MFNRLVNINPCATKDPLYKHVSTLVLTWMSNHMRNKMWDEITLLFANANGYTVDVLEWINNPIPHFTIYVNTYPCWDQSKSMLDKWAAPGRNRISRNFVLPQSISVFLIVLKFYRARQCYCCDMWKFLEHLVQCKISYGQTGFRKCDFQKSIGWMSHIILQSIIINGSILNPGEIIIW